MKRLLLSALLVSGAALLSPATAQSVVISEVLASNSAGLVDPDFGAASDWIELHNPSGEAVDLGGSTLTDRFGEPAKWRIPDGTTIPAGGFLLLWADDEDTAGTALHTNFRLSAGGEEVGLFDASGAVLDTLSFGAQANDVSYGRLPGGGTAFFDTPTPGTANTTAATTLAPVASLASGFYGAGAIASFSAPEAATVRYTSDGTLPTETSPVLDGPLALTQTITIRAAAFVTGREPSSVVTRAYFVDEATALPVVSLVTDPAGFFSDQDGIYVEGTNGIPGRCRSTPVNWNQDWERPVHLSFFEPDGMGGQTLALEHGAGVKIFGGCSRIYPQKSLTLHARGEYGAARFEHRFFPELDIESFDEVILRSSAQDWWRTMFRDGMIQTLTRHMDLDGQAYRPAAVFLNGEYWGLHNIREKLNEDYLAAHYDVGDDDVEIIEGTWGGQSAHYDALDDFLDANSLASPEAFAEVERRVDVDQYTDYLIAQIYAANGDWPGNNLKLWRPLAQDGRWRWMLFDTDFGFGGNSNGQTGSNILAQALAPGAPGWPNPPWSTKLFRALIENDGFRHTFIQRMAAHTGTTFDPQRTLGVIDSLKANIEAEIPRHKSRWAQSISFGRDWDTLVEIMRDFARRRKFAIRDHVIAEFPEVTGLQRLTVTAASGGRVFAEGVRMAPLRLDGTPEASGSDASGDIFSAVFYKGVPLELTAIADEGYVFAGWTGETNASADTLVLSLGESEALLTATFALSTDAEPLASAASSLGAYPNPASGDATIEARLGAPGDLSVRVFDMLGREVVVLARGPHAAGMHRLRLDAGALPAGVYSVLMTADGFRAARRLVVAR